MHVVPENRDTGIAVKHIQGMSLENYLRTKNTKNYVEQHHAFKNRDDDAEN